MDTTKNINSANYRIDFSEETTSREKTYLRDIPYDSFFTGEFYVTDSCWHQDGLFYKLPDGASSALVNLNPPYSKSFAYNGATDPRYVRNYKSVKILLKIEER